MSETPAASLVRLPAPVHRLRELSVRLLQKAFNNLFDGADEVLFQLADAATTNTDQNTYFEAMRELRLQRRTMESRFWLAFDQAFARLSGERSAGDEPGALAQADTPDFDAVELALSFEAMIARARKTHAAALQTLTLALNQWVPVGVSARNNPLGPQVLCDAFHQQVACLSMGPKGKQVLAQLFDKALMQQLDTLYARLQEGLQVEPGASPPSSETPEIRPSGQALASQYHPETPQVAAATTLSRAELVRLLSRLQAEAAQQLSAVGPGPMLSLADLQAQLQRLAGQSLRLAEGDWQALSLMQKMCEFIVRDQSLPEPMQMLLSGLHLPLLKVAVLDAEVFGEAGHTARRLLNELASAALGWQPAAAGEGEVAVTSDDAPDELRQQMQDCVATVLQQFDEDLSVLQRALEQFHGHRQQELRRATLMERRTLDAEDGKAHTERARRLVDEELQARSAAQPLPECVSALLRDYWHKVMLVVLLKHGPASQEWFDSCGLVETLVWSVTAPMDTAGRARLMQALPGLLQQLRTGLELVSCNPFELNQLLGQLQQVHLQRMSQPAAAAVAAVAETESAVAQAGASDNTAEPQAEAAEPVLAAEDEPVADEPDAALLAQVARVAKGSWFEVSEPGAAPYRCRLAAVISSVDKYIFVNRAGAKVAEKNRREFALALERGEFVVLDDGMLFDRALSSVIGDVRRGRTVTL